MCSCCFRIKLSRSFKIIETDTNRKPISDFLLVFCCNYISILYRFQDILVENLRFITVFIFVLSQFLFKYVNFVMCSCCFRIKLSLLGLILVFFAIFDLSCFGFLSFCFMSLCFMYDAACHRTSNVNRQFIGQLSVHNVNKVMK